MTETLERPPVRRIGVRELGNGEFVLRVDFRDNDGMNFAKSQLPTAMRNDELTTFNPDNHSMFATLSGVNSTIIRNFLRDIGTPEAAISAPQFSAALGGAAARSMALEGLANFGITQVAMNAAPQTVINVGTPDRSAGIA